MAHDPMLDSESRRNRFVGALECVQNLVSNGAVGERLSSLEGDIKIAPLAYLLDILVDEAHLLYDEPSCLHGVARNDN